MKKPHRFLALTLCLCMLPLGARAVIEPTTHTASGSPVYRSVFTLQTRLLASGFPSGTKTDYQAWEDYLGKLSLRGTIDTQDFLQRFSRVYFDGGLYLGDKKSLPFTYDGYYSFRYLRSPALDGASVHMQMYNFFEFMLKPYDYYSLPTQYLALLMYPEASYELGQVYYEPIAKALGGAGTRTIPYEKLNELALELDLIAQEDPDNVYRLDNYLRCLLLDIGGFDMTYDALSCLEDWLAFLDPEEQGLQVTVAGDGERWVIGQTEVFAKTEKDGALTFSLTLPNADGYALCFTWAQTPKDVGWDLGVSLKVTLEGEERVSVGFGLLGMPKENETEANGTAYVSFGGAALTASTQQFAFRYQRDQLELPFSMSLAVDWLHPQTGKAAATLSYKADMTQHDNTILVDRAIDNQDDFFHLNESYIEEYKARFAPTMALAMAPFLLEMPLPVFNDIFNFLNDTGILLTAGIE